MPNVPALEVSALGDDAQLLGACIRRWKWPKAQLLAMPEVPAVSRIRQASRGGDRLVHARPDAFSPDYVRLVLNENFEDAKTLLLEPLMAIHARTS